MSLPCIAEAVKIDGIPRIRITCNGYILGEVKRVEDVEPLLAGHGKTLADVEFKEQPAAG